MWDSPDNDAFLFDVMETVNNCGRRPDCRKAKNSDPDRLDRNQCRVRTSGHEARGSPRR